MCQGARQLSGRRGQLHQAKAPSAASTASRVVARQRPDNGVSRAAMRLGWLAAGRVPQPENRGRPKNYVLEFAAMKFASPAFYFYFFGFLKRLAEAVA